MNSNSNQIGFDIGDSEKINELRTIENIVRRIVLIAAIFVLVFNYDRIPDGWPTYLAVISPVFVFFFVKAVFSIIRILKH